MEGMQGQPVGLTAQFNMCAENSQTEKTEGKDLLITQEKENKSTKQIM